MHKNIKNAIIIIKALGLPKAQHNERSALCLLSLLNIKPDNTWQESEHPLIGITPMMDFSNKYYKKDYAPNTRETFRRFTMHQFVEAGIALYNPDDPGRPVNSPKTVYQISPIALDIIRAYGTKKWKEKLFSFRQKISTLSAKYKNERNLNLIPVKISDMQEIKISPGKHNLLMKDIIEKFAPRFLPSSQLVYIGDTEKKWGYFDEVLAQKLNIIVDTHGKMPDVVIYHQEKNWLVLIESVTSHGPVDGKRHIELNRLFSLCKIGLVFVTAFPNKSLMAKYLSEIAWETEVWVADNPSHLIHFNGERFLGPYT